MSNPLSNLKIERTWHALTVFGAVGCITSAATKGEFFFLFFSIFIFGIGNWINHPIQCSIQGGIKATKFERYNYPLGLLHEILNAMMFVPQFIVLYFFS